MGTGLNCTKTKLHVVTKLHEGTKLHECTKLHEAKFARITFLHGSKKIQKKIKRKKKNSKINPYSIVVS